MRKIFVLSFVVLSLAALTMTPGFATDVDPAIQADLTVEEPLMTPAETPEVPDLLDPSQDLLEEKIEQCSGPHPECPEGCECAAITVNKVYCTCP